MNLTYALSISFRFYINACLSCNDLLSYQDSIFKAENLCKGKADGMSTWKIAKEDVNCGRIEAEFQLEKASYISHIDIGVYQ